MSSYNTVIFTSILTAFILSIWITYKHWQQHSNFSKINQQIHNVFVLYLFNLYFYFPSHMLQHYTAILKGVHFSYIKLYRALICDS
jgi:uncharacterized membrane protein YcgQ (UPF0703/DUF1980 family)